MTSDILTAPVPAKRAWNEWTAEDLAALYQQGDIRPTRVYASYRDPAGTRFACIVGRLAIEFGWQPEANFFFFPPPEFFEGVGYPQRWTDGLALGFDGALRYPSDWQGRAGYALGKATAALVFGGEAA